MNSFTIRIRLIGTALLVAFYFMFGTSTTFAQGVGVVDATSETYLLLDANRIDVQVEDQVAIVTTTQVFRNTSPDSTLFTYAFPLADDASPTSIRWQINDIWYRGAIEPVPQDTTLPGEGGGNGGGRVPLDDYLGETPLIFEIEQHLGADSLVTVELQYAQLLPYEFGNVDFVFPNRYTAIQNDPVAEQQITFNLTSQRSVLDVSLLSHSGGTVENNGTTASLMYDASELPLTTDYRIQYALSQEELGLFGFSTWYPDSLVVDEAGQGFFTFVAEPDASGNTEVINKVFTLIIDRSGSMQGTKIEQAREAASFIVNNLNEGDLFNIVDFSSGVSSFRNEHVPFTELNRDAAVNYINFITASGATNISEALTVAISQFTTVTAENTANLIIFFTDGQANRGVSDTQGILDLVAEEVNVTETQPVIYTFGIGADVDTQLLTRLARNNNGLVEFLGNDQIESRITDFYLRVRNPVLLNTSISFDRTGIVELFPAPLPSLYKGQQMIVSGRYDTPGPLNITLSGNAFGQPISFNYTLDLAGEPVTRYQFLPKIWAKQKIDQLLVAYFSLNPTSSEAKALRDEVIELGVNYGIVTPFTSFQGGEEEGGDGVSVSVEEEAIAETPERTRANFEVLGNYPNPFQHVTHIQLNIQQLEAATVKVRIYDSVGRLIRTLEAPISGPGLFDIEWDGLTDAGTPVSSGSYIAIIEYGDTMLSHVMTVVR